MKKRFFAFLIALASGLCWGIAENLAVSNGGGFSFAPNSGSHFEPMLFDANWGHCRAFGGWNDENGGSDGPWTRTFQIVGNDESPVVQGKVTYDLRRDAATNEPVAYFTWDFTAVKDFEGKSFCLSWALPCEQYASNASVGKVVFGDKAVELPQPAPVDNHGWTNRTLFAQPESPSVHVEPPLVGNSVHFARKTDATAPNMDSFGKSPPDWRRLHSNSHRSIGQSGRIQQRRLVRYGAKVPWRLDRRRCRLHPNRHR